MDRVGAPRHTDLNEDKAMETKANFALMGAFVILSALALMGFAFFMANSEFRRDFADYDILFNGPVALEEGANVRYIGIKVGEVETVRINRADPSKARVRIRIDANAPVKVDSKATIELAGITGVTFVQISAGSDRAGLLKRRPGETVPMIDAGQTQFEALIGGGQETLTRVNQSLERVNKLLTDENIAHIEATLQNIEGFTAHLADEEGVVKELNLALGSVRRASDQFSKASSSFGDFGSTAGRQLETFSQDVTALVKDLRGTVEQSNKVLSESRRAVRVTAEAIQGPAVGALEDARMVTQDLQVLINRLDRIARRVEESPEQLVVGDPIPYE